MGQSETRGQQGRGPDRKSLRVTRAKVAAAKRDSTVSTKPEKFGRMREMASEKRGQQGRGPDRKSLSPTGEKVTTAKQDSTMSTKRDQEIRTDAGNSAHSMTNNVVALRILCRNGQQCRGTQRCVSKTRGG
mmetsp:Transcript_21441/g.36786  ORF Transcript_21441/g.36786 Transcript_21441/m.36786 type:complete len:131 (-) Transcript_21441:15-407(-)